MLAARDQENRIQGGQVAGAAKALQSQTSKHGPLKTPFKVPLNDENARRELVTGKKGLLTTGKGNENIRLGGKSQLLGDAFKTPLGMRPALGPKTTNAKAKTLQIPVAGPDDDLAKSKQQSASARKKGPRISHAKTELVFSENDLDEAKDIGVIHPRPRDLPDVPDDLPEIDLTLLPPLNVQTAARMMYHYPGPDGLSRAQKDKMRQAEEMRILEAREEAMMTRSMELYAPPQCMHEPECNADCKDEPERRRRIEEEYRRTLASIESSRELTAGPKKDTKAIGIRKKPQASSLKSTVIPLRTSTKPTRPNTGSTGPSGAQSRAAVAKLSMKPSTSAQPATTMPPSRPVARAPASARSQLAPSQGRSVSSGPSRYAAAKQVSNTTMGYAQGRAVSGAKRKSILPRSDMVVFQAPAQEMDKEAIARQEEMRRTLLEDALDDFQMEMPEA